MKTTIGGGRLGSGNKMELINKNFERSTHDLSEIFRSSMSAGTLVPFMCKVGLPGDDWEIKLNCDVQTLPTIGALFGSYKVQLDIFSMPVRLMNKGTYMNRQAIGLDMSQVLLPQIELRTNNHANYLKTYDDNEHINPSSIHKYLGISGLGNITGATNPARRRFNAVKYIMYWDIVKNYYANKAEGRGFVIHTGATNTQEITGAILTNEDVIVGDIFNQDESIDVDVNLGVGVVIQFGANAQEPDPANGIILLNTIEYTLADAFENITWDDTTKRLTLLAYTMRETGVVSFEVQTQTINGYGEFGSNIGITAFPLSNIDEFKDQILEHPFNSGAFVINENTIAPYGLTMEQIGTGAEASYSMQYTQEGLALKTYQSDLFNNWMDTEWIDGTNGINEITAISTVGDSFTVDAFILASKVYKMLNKIAVSGGSYDDWIEAVWDEERNKGVYSPVYHGGLIKELAFQEVVSLSNTDVGGEEQPLGTLAGKGIMTKKHKGGNVDINLKEPSYIMGIISITPRIEYSQGNEWDVNLRTMDDFHKPDMDGIGFEDVITERMWWGDSYLNSATGAVTHNSAGKQPAWINYMTAVNKCYGNFAVETNEMFMVLNRRYDKLANGRIGDLTTYIDPTKFNHIFAQTKIDAQNFRVQISKMITVRRKMSAKIIPNL